MAAIPIFLATYLVLAIGRLPGFRVDRTGACIIGASLMIAANLIVVQRARHEAQIGFWEYFKVGAPLTVVTFAAGVILLG